MARLVSQEAIADKISLQESPPSLHTMTTLGFETPWVDTNALLQSTTGSLFDLVPSRLDCRRKKVGTDYGFPPA